ncbi:hypothetical protein GE21DRAFT_1311213 [Neurospora crassa]|nr:hypothetical protein GE21DRAFT_1311213 [Neurospora crassa]
MFVNYYTYSYKRNDPPPIRICGPYTRVIVGPHPTGGSSERSSAFSSDLGPRNRNP